MARNEAGGYTFQISNWQFLSRFLVIGSEGGNYYAGQKKVTIEGYDALTRCTGEDGTRVVELITDVLTNRKAVKPDYALFAAAYVAVHGDINSRSMIYQHIPLICIIAPHLFRWMEFVRELRAAKKGISANSKNLMSGSGFARAISRWYFRKDPRTLAYQMAKYPGRHGFTHRDALRIAHPFRKESSGAQLWAEDTREQYEWLFRYATHPEKAEINVEAISNPDTYIGPIQGKILVNLAITQKEVIDTVTQYRLTHEMVPGKWKGSAEWYEAIIPNCPIGALIRQLPGITNAGLLDAFSAWTSTITEKLSNEQSVRKSGIHPVVALSAMQSYKSGKSSGTRYRSDAITWKPNAQIIEALEGVFYTALDNIPDTGKNILLAVDKSGSMIAPVSGLPNICSCEVAAAMAMAIVRTQSHSHIIGYDTDIKELPGITKNTRLADAIEHIGQAGAGTNCGVPFMYANQASLPVDAVIQITDMESWAGTEHTYSALNQLRSNQNNPEIRAIAMATATNKGSILDPKDPNSMDIIGLDPTSASLATKFAGGEF
jgi:60 kDa SS-A/Ro ribonucleoprotein